MYVGKYVCVFCVKHRASIDVQSGRLGTIAPKRGKWGSRNNTRREM